jgi:hypothetical protein
MAGKRGRRSKAAAQWQERLERWQRLQCTVGEFCRREGVSQPSFYHWRRRLASGSGSRSVRDVTRGAAFIPVQVIADDLGGTSAGLASPVAGDRPAAIEIAFRELVCRVPTEVDEVTLRRIVRVLCEEARRC